MNLVFQKQFQNIFTIFLYFPTHENFFQKDTHNLRIHMQIKTIERMKNL